MQEINIMDLSDDIKDKFWTLTVYFNSLKDLGKCSTLVDDDVKDFIKRTAFRLGSAKDARMIARADELTSRVNTTQLNETLDKLEKHCYSKENILLDVDKTTFEQGNALIFYVGTSRARIKLEIAAILSDDDCKEILMSILNYRGKIRRAQKDLAGALNAIGSLDS